jgi:hypothetical protein
VGKYGTARQATDYNIIRRMRFACRITKATDIHSEYVIFIAFPRQQWLRKRVSVLCLYVHCPSCYFSLREFEVCNEIAKIHVTRPTPACILGI